MIDAQAIIRTVNRAEEAWSALCGATGDRPQAAPGPRAPSPEPQVPINVAAVDQAETLRQQITGWARILEEESGEMAPALDVPHAARHLAMHAVWVAGSGWALDLVEELRTSTRQAHAMLGALPRRTPIAKPCECGARLWAYLDGGQGAMRVECDEGHVMTASQAEGAALVSVRGAQRILGIRRTTISEAVRSGAVTNHGSEARPVVDTREIEQYLRERLGDRSV